MQFTEKLWRGFETLGNGDAKKSNGYARRGYEKEMRCSALHGDGKEAHRTALRRRSFDWRWRGMEPKGQATQRLGQASQRTAAEMQSKDLIGKGDEWPGQAEDMQGYAMR